MFYRKQKSEKEREEFVNHEWKLMVCGFPGVCVRVIGWFVLAVYVASHCATVEAGTDAF